MTRWIVLALGLLAALAALLSLTRLPEGPGPGDREPPRGEAPVVPPASENPGGEDIGEESRRALRDILREAQREEEEARR